jgi:hypothetical protein
MSTFNDINKWANRKRENEAFKKGMIAKNKSRIWYFFLSSFNVFRNVDDDDDEKQKKLYRSMKYFSIA